MENTFRTAVFGGFNRQDVTAYISRQAGEYRERLEALEKENGELRGQTADRAELAEQLEQLRQEQENLAQELQEERTAKEQYRARAEECAAQLEQLGHLRQEAEEYSGVKAHIADIELEARRRADGIMADAKAQSDALLSETDRKIRELRRDAAAELGDLYEAYQRLTAAFQTASTHVAEELRRMDVAVGQLPLAFDKVRSQLEKLKDQI